MILACHLKDYFLLYSLAFLSMKYSFLQFSLQPAAMDNFKYLQVDLKQLTHSQYWFNFHFYWL